MGCASSRPEGFSFESVDEAKLEPLNLTLWPRSAWTKKNEPTLQTIGMRLEAVGGGAVVVSDIAAESMNADFFALGDEFSKIEGVSVRGNIEKCRAQLRQLNRKGKVQVQVMRRVGSTQRKESDVSSRRLQRDWKPLLSHAHGFVSHADWPTGTPPFVSHAPRPPTGMAWAPPIPGQHLLRMVALKTDDTAVGSSPPPVFAAPPTAASAAGVTKVAHDVAKSRVEVAAARKAASKLATTNGSESAALLERAAAAEARAAKLEKAAEVPKAVVAAAPTTAVAVEPTRVEAPAPPAPAAAPAAAATGVGGDAPPKGVTSQKASGGGAWAAARGAVAEEMATVRKEEVKAVALSAFGDKNPPPATSLREGYLTKAPVHGHLFSRPRRRWFVLTETHIEWFEDEQSATGGSNTKGRMYFHRDTKLDKGPNGGTLTINSQGESLLVYGDELPLWEVAILDAVKLAGTLSRMASSKLLEERA
jgi:hypothetical protein